MSSAANESQEGTPTSTPPRSNCAHALTQVGHQWVKDDSGWVRQWRDVCVCGHAAGPWEDE